MSVLRPSVFQIIFGFVLYFHWHNTPYGNSVWDFVMKVDLSHFSWKKTWSRHGGQLITFGSWLYWNIMLDEGLIGFLTMNHRSIVRLFTSIKRGLQAKYSREIFSDELICISVWDELAQWPPIQKTRVQILSRANCVQDFFSLYSTKLNVPK